MPIPLIILTTPLIAALIGWLTNRLAIRMLFHPRQPRSLLGWRWQGLIPKRQPEIASRIGELVERDLFSGDWLAESLAKVDLEPHLQALSQRLIRERLAPRLKKVPLLGSFISESTLEQVEESVHKELMAEAQPLITQLLTEGQQNLNIRKQVEERVRQFDVERLESVFLTVAGKEFRIIEILGGVLGFGIGLLQWLVFFLNR